MHKCYKRLNKHKIDIVWELIKLNIIHWWHANILNLAHTNVIVLKIKFKYEATLTPSRVK